MLRGYLRCHPTQMCIATRLHSFLYAVQQALKNIIDKIILTDHVSPKGYFSWQLGLYLARAVNGIKQIMSGY